MIGPCGLWHWLDGEDATPNDASAFGAQGNPGANGVCGCDDALCYERHNTTRGEWLEKSGISWRGLDGRPAFPGRGADPLTGTDLNTAVICLGRQLEEWATEMAPGGYGAKWRNSQPDSRPWLWTLMTGDGCQLWGGYIQFRAEVLARLVADAQEAPILRRRLRELEARQP